jgi:hypothetical protein
LALSSFTREAVVGLSDVAEYVPPPMPILNLLRPRKRKEREGRSVRPPVSFFDGAGRSGL